MEEADSGDAVMDDVKEAIEQTILGAYDRGWREGIFASIVSVSFGAMIGASWWAPLIGLALTVCLQEALTRIMRHKRQREAQKTTEMR